jgi:uncharacterized protein (UPF0212 family)
MIRTTSFYDVICDICGATLSELENALGAATADEAKAIAEKNHGFVTNRAGDALCPTCQKDHTIKVIPRRRGHHHG